MCAQCTVSYLGKLQMLPVKSALTENSRNSHSLEERLKLNNWVLSINRGFFFSPAGTENWALLKTPEEHMLRHSLLRPQMFLNSWLHHVAFPFSPRYCANYFSARSTWATHVSDCTNSTLFFFFFFVRSSFLVTPEAPNTRPTEYLPSCVTHWFLNTIDCFEMLMGADGAFACSSLFQPNMICAERISCRAAHTLLILR